MGSAAGRRNLAIAAGVAFVVASGVAILMGALVALMPGASAAIDGGDNGLDWLALMAAVVVAAVLASAGVRLLRKRRLSLPGRLHVGVATAVLAACAGYYLAAV